MRKAYLNLLHPQDILRNRNTRPWNVHPSSRLTTSTKRMAGPCSGARRSSQALACHHELATAIDPQEDEFSSLGERTIQDRDPRRERQPKLTLNHLQVASAPGPSTKLPRHFTWPEMIGFAFAEASGHPLTTAQIHQWIASNVDGYGINDSAQRKSIAVTQASRW